MDIAEAAPVVLVGRGGSGTRILAELAHANGVFLGSDLNLSFDSVEWVETIYPLAVQALTARDSSANAGDAPHRLRQRARLVLERAGRDPDALWGWKLPETTLIIPDVMRAFPRARFVHLVRHPYTSALRRTHITSRLDNPIGAAVLSAAYRDAGLDPGSLATDGEFVHNAASWNFQVRSAVEALEELPAPARAWRVHYEELCAAPSEAAAGLAQYLERAAPIPATRPVIDPNRMNGVSPSDARLERVWSICGATAARVGYSVER